MKYIITILFTGMFLISCGDDKGTDAQMAENNPKTRQTADTVSDGAVVVGTIKNANGKTIVLERWSASGQMETLAQSVIAADGSFKLKTPFRFKELYRISVQPITSNMDYMQVFLDSGEVITLTADANRISDTYKATGSVENDKLTEYMVEVVRGLQKKTDSLRTVSINLPNSDLAKRAEILKLIEDYTQKKDAKMDKFIGDNIGNPITFFIIESFIGSKRQKGESISNADIALLEQSRDVVKASMPRSFMANYVEVQVGNYRKLMSDDQFLANGTVVPDISLPDPQGNIRKLSDLRGKVVLLDFWASWCGPCRKDNPHVVELYNKYKNLGFEIYSVSLDNSKDKWVAAIQADNLTWKNHVSDLRAWQSSAATEFKVTSIPFTILIDREGKIVGKGDAVRGHNLDAYLTKIFGS